MPVLTPQYGLQFMISDLASEVILRCENRTSDLARAYIWVRDALIEISSNPDYRDDFDSLELWGVMFNLTAGTQEYAYSNLLPVSSASGLSVLNQSTLDVFLWQDPPTNSIRNKLRVAHYQETDKLPTVSKSTPQAYYRFGDAIGFSPVPDKTYQVQARILQYHPIADQQLQSTIILLPREWNEILVWAAVERGFMELLEFEKAGEVHQLLFGDPKHPEKPGLMSSLKMRRSKEIWRQTQSLAVDVRPYGYGR